MITLTWCHILHNMYVHCPCLAALNAAVEHTEVKLECSAYHLESLSLKKAEKLTDIVQVEINSPE